jgi:hypothetical protein
MEIKDITDHIVASIVHGLTTPDPKAKLTERHTVGAACVVYRRMFGPGALALYVECPAMPDPVVHVVVNFDLDTWMVAVRRLDKAVPNFDLDTWMVAVRRLEAVPPVKPTTYPIGRFSYGVTRTIAIVRDTIRTALADEAGKPEAADLDAVLASLPDDDE